MKRKNSLYVLILLILAAGCGSPVTVEEIYVSGVESPVISLNSTWKFAMEPPDGFWRNNTEFHNWPDIMVPGECQMQGFAIKHDQPNVYKKKFHVPPDFANKHIQLNFYGLYSFARVWVNGQFIRDHYGGFTKWSCDITGQVEPGEDATLTIEFMDPVDDISFGSGYAKHQIGATTLVMMHYIMLLLYKQMHYGHSLGSIFDLLSTQAQEENITRYLMDIFWELVHGIGEILKVDIIELFEEIIRDHQKAEEISRLFLPVFEKQRAA